MYRNRMRSMLRRMLAVTALAQGAFLLGVFMMAVPGAPSQGAVGQQ